MSEIVECSSCAADVPVNHKFCGKCGHPTGAPAPDDGVERTAFFGTMQTVGKAKLILIRGEGMDGVSYHLNTAEHVAGRKAGAILFPEDNYLSPRHANFYYEGGELKVRDEGSLNGVFVRIDEPVHIANGDVFLAGEELLRVEVDDLGGEAVGVDETQFFSSPRPADPYRITQLYEGGRLGSCYYARDGALTIGRENCDLNYPDDRFISGRHCRVEFDGQGATITDLQSRNGTYVRVQGQRELSHGDYLFLGKQLLRVEITTS